MKLVLIHGIWNYNLDKDDAVVKQEILSKWIESLKDGIETAKLDSAKLDTIDIELVYYGDLYKSFGTLISAVGDDLKTQGLAEEIATEIDESKVAAAKKNVPLTGIGNQLLKDFVEIIQGKFPFLDSTVLKVFAQETDLYFHNNLYFDQVKTRFLNAVTSPGQETVIISHSMGTVISYDLLVNNNDFQVNKLITLGSPLAVNYFQKLIKAKHVIEMPASIKDGQWFNAVGIEDFVSLFPLDSKRFNTTPIIDNKSVQTFDKSPHDIRGYLSNPDVAIEIYKSLGF
ncbi:lipase/acyltransferase domain-containing protein [Acinetobacter sp. ANC 4193]